MATSERSFEAALRFNVTSRVPAEQARRAAHGRGGRGRDRQHLVALGEHGAAVLHRVRDREGRALDDDAGDGARARAEDPRQRDRGRRHRDRRRSRTCSPTRRCARSSRTTRRCSASACPPTSRPRSSTSSSPASSFVTGKIFEVDGGVEAPAFTIPFERAVSRDYFASSPGPRCSGRSRYVLMPGSASHDVGDRVHAVHRGRDQTDLRVLADDRRVQAVERARHRRLGVELDLEALLAERPRRVEVLRRPSAS